MDIVQFVDKIDAAPTVRLDLNNESPWATKTEGTDLSPPPLRQAWAGTLLTDGEQLTAAAYDNRQLRLKLELIASSVDNVAASLQALWRELNRPANILRWQPTGASFPVHFKTFRSADNAVVDYPGPGLLRTVDVRIAAEPFAYGLRQTLSQVTVSSNPAAGSNGCYFDVTGVKGDVETPLHLSLDDGFTVLRQPMFAVRRRGTPSAMPFVLQAESMTLGTDAALGASNDAALSGSGQNYVRISYATNASMQNRVSSTSWPSTPSVDVRGTYRVLARIRRNTGTDTHYLRLSYGNSSSPIYGDIVSTPSASITDPIWVDLGLVPYPTGQDPVTDMSAAEIPVGGQYLAVQTQRVSGAGTLDLDCLLFVPADDRLLIATLNPDAGAVAQVIDSARTMAYGVGASGEIRPTIPAQIAGGAPMVSPGVTNRIAMINILQGTPGDTITTTRKVTPSYWPRYLHIAAAGS